jgi:NADH-quinone oxidoreductase subunit F
MRRVLLQPDCHTKKLSSWLKTLGGTGLEEALAAPKIITPKIEAVGLRGLGGSGFPVFKKWQLMGSQSNHLDKYLICNGNEDEPGTFKDEYLLTHTPHPLIEGALIAAVANHINHIIFYINPQQQSISIMTQAVDLWRDHELFQKVERFINKPLTLEVVASSGQYIGGEETAAIGWLEGEFPFPRGKPPYPSEAGINGCPTLINNIETLANLPHIMSHGVKWYQDLGLGKATGTKLYSLSGDVANQGLFELPMGTPLAKLIYNYGGGTLVGNQLKAVFTGGVSNKVLIPGDLDVPLDFDSVASRGSSLGTGAMIVIAEDTDIVKRVAGYIEFYARSSCGQCPSCKTGTYYLDQLFKKMGNCSASENDIKAIETLCQILPGSGKCHLIDGAIKIVSSSMDYFMDEYHSKVSKC